MLKGFHSTDLNAGSSMLRAAAGDAQQTYLLAFNAQKRCGC